MCPPLSAVVWVFFNDHTLIGHLRGNLRLKEIAERFNNHAGKLHGAGRCSKSSALIPDS
jgi:hypothetical protein